MYLCEFNFLENDMFRIKRLYSFVLKTFLPLILATFSVCLFILLMQFLWKVVQDMVGKGVDISVLGEMFLYAATTFIPMALPLSILLGSLMTFGNLGEHMELLAMKASGISLTRIMKPLIVFVFFITILSFVVQNNVVPPAQAKLYTFWLSLRQKSPELNIPEGSFFKDIPGYNIYVRNKDKDGLLRNVMIYNYSDGFDQADVIVADSGRLKVADDGESLLLTLYNGESFGNLPQGKSTGNRTHIPYRRETFKLRETLIEYDTNFNMADESIFQNRDITKNLIELRTFADSVKIQIDSTAAAMAPNLRRQVYEAAFIQPNSPPGNRNTRADTTYVHDFQLLFDNSSIEKQLTYLEAAQSRVNNIKTDYEMRKMTQAEMTKQVRSHELQFHIKFSLSFACLFFFFIGAPLGAIIRKGGLGMPAVLSVIIFLLYYTVDTFGSKLAKQGVLQIWQGAWLSSLLLVSLGSFFTYKAVNDSVIMNPDAWKDWLQRLIGKKEVRIYSRKEVIMQYPDYRNDLSLMDKWNIQARDYLKRNARLPSYLSFWKRDFQDKQLAGLISSMEEWIEDLQNSDQNLIIGKLMDYPVIVPLHFGKINSLWKKWACAVFFPAGLIVYFTGLYKLKQIRQDLSASLKVNEDIEKEIIACIN